MLATTSAEIPVPLLMQTYFTSAARGKLAGADIPQLQAMLQKVTDPTASPAAVTQAQQDVARLANQKMWAIPITFEPVLFGAKKSIKGLDNMELGVVGMWILRYVYVAK
jgi:hypothetical protein